MKNPEAVLETLRYGLLKLRSDNSECGIEIDGEESHA